MKKFLIAVIALVSSAIVAFGQMATKNYDYKDFSVINASNDFQVVLQKGNAYAVQLIVTESYLPYVTVNQEGSVLVLDLDEQSLPSELRKSFFSKTKSEFKALVSVPDGSINAVYLSENATLTSSDNLSSDTFIVSATDGSSISKLYLKCGRAEIRLEKKAEASIAVECDNLVVIQSAMSNLSLTHKTKNSSIDMSGACNVVLNGKSEFLSLASKGSAKSEITGETNDAVFKCSGSSNVSAENLQCGMLDVDLTGFCSVKANVKDEITVTMSGGSTLSFAGEPAVDIKSIKNSSVSRLSHD